jgi:hypothetical protein
MDLTKPGDFLEVSMMYKPRQYRLLLTALSCAIFALPAAASQARIVRLSDVQGSVQIDKNAGLGFESAFLNLPIVQGTQLRTRANGRAEIEFEDGSTLRVTPNTTVLFSTLGASDVGKRLSTVHLLDGRVYVNWLGKSGDKFTLDFSHERVDLSQPAHFRVAYSSHSAEIASFKNGLEVSGPAGTVKVDKKKMVSFDVDDQDKSTLAKGFASGPYDEWDKQSVEYHDQYAKNNSTQYGYGYSDLSYYGSYSNFPGYGMLWQPYFTGAGWNPYMDGAWSWYPGMGYLWASAYPWGWMPYYYGNWVYAQGLGWGWRPGGLSGWHGGLHYVGADATFHAPVEPKGVGGTVIVGRGGATTSTVKTTSLTVSRGSAGMGIPRGALDNLQHLSSHVAKTGVAEVHASPQYSANSSRANGFAYAEPAHATAMNASMGRASSAPAGHSSGGGAHR